MTNNISKYNFASMKVSKRSKSKYPKDPNQLAKMIVDVLTNDTTEDKESIKESTDKLKIDSTINESIASSQKSSDNTTPRGREQS